MFYSTCLSNIHGLLQELQIFITIIHNAACFQVSLIHCGVPSKAKGVANNILGSLVIMFCFTSSYTLKFVSSANFSAPQEICEQ